MKVKGYLGIIFGLALFYVVFGLIMILNEMGKNSESAYLLFLFGFVVLPSVLIIFFLFKEKKQKEILEEKIRKYEIEEEINKRLEK